MLPIHFFRNRAFTLTNTASLLMFFGMFGSIFLFAQFFQTVQGYSPLEAGLRFLPWTAMPIFIAPIAGALSDRIGGTRIMAIGLTLQAIALAWIAAIATPNVPYVELIPPFVLAGIGMAHVFAPVANVILSAVRPEEEGPSLRRQQRAPRARRRLRRRRARLHLRQLRRVRLRATVRQRTHAGHLGWRRDRRGSLARCACDSTHTAGGRATAPCPRGMNHLAHGCAGRRHVLGICSPRGSPLVVAPCRAVRPWCDPLGLLLL
jgi:Major Facilitator Superfamily